MTNYIERYWRDATPEDAIKEPPMMARFLEGKSEWFIGELLGCWRDLHCDNHKWASGNGLCYTTCQVYDAPDPGEGWRLIDVERERPQVGDEIYEGARDRWIVRLHTKPYDKSLIYRRRIEQPKPAAKYVPFTWEDRGELRGRWIYRNKDGDTIEEVAYKIDSRTFTTVAEYLLRDGWRFMDTGEPVGKKVTQ